MTVKLVWSTPDGEGLIAYMARVSSNNQDNPDYERLIKYLLDNKHFSPFEMVNACVEINTTRDVGRQILRHRSFSFQEFSQRYADVDTSEPLPLRQCRFRGTTNRQSSRLPETSDEEDTVLDWEGLQDEVSFVARRAYRHAIDNGIAAEVARVVLPEGLTPTRMYMNGSLRSWIHYWEVRCDEHTQKEHRDIAEEIREIVLSEYPVLKKILCN
jgi:thymidylate synthase (FAD)